ncbi:Alpha/Beta hydrolase protein [Crucibulum laeve]|uniref:Alpha/Beta hydrolase protein n=1 Tax=Crucibulum laeve TaxID=68775 RepID=A0A5C3LZF4_9AGAR|nr:Alpha/Beta hydrolase protein [Crucibulum laeve]
MATQAEPVEITFKQVDGIDIKMDVYIPENASEKDKAPVLLWWHGLSPHMLSAPSVHNLCIVSPDYRLAPQTRLPEILSDCAHALSFLSTPQFTSATSNRVDTTRIVVSGSSAGGWLALFTGTGVGYEACGLAPPKRAVQGGNGQGIKGIASLYPITDMEDAFWKGQKPLVYIDRVIEKKEVEAYLDPNAKKTCASALDDPRSIFYHYMVQEGILPSLLLPPSSSIPASAFSIARNLSLPLPPTYIVHGTADTKVPHSQAVDVVSAYAKVGAEVVYDERPGLDHGFDKDEKCTMEEMYKFVKKVI